MFFYDYNDRQLENKAEEQLRGYDAERLTIPKKVDAIGFVEFYLGLQFDPQLLSPYQEILGLTSFNDGYWYVWPNFNLDQLSPMDKIKRDFMPTDVLLAQDIEKYGMPEKHPVPKGTVLVDARLFDNGANEGRANFTILHEAFHWILHQRVFSRQEVLFQRYCDQNSLATFSKPKGKDGIKKTEWQANAAAAAFLMPREAVSFALREVLKLSQPQKFPISFSTEVDTAIGTAADMFGASKAAMRNRVNNLGLVSNIPIDLRSNRSYSTMPF